VGLARLADWEKVFANVPTNVRPNLAVQYAVDWLEWYSVEPQTASAPDSACVATIRNEAGSRKFALDALERLAELAEFKESDLLRVLPESFVGPPVSFAVSAQLGDLIARKSWSRAAKELFSVAGSRPDLYPAISRCLGLLDLRQRLTATWIWRVERRTAISDDELWVSVGEIALVLYPWGPGEFDVWERAGGDRSDIRASASGRESWREVLTRARLGGTQVTMRSLVGVMREDYKSNEILREVSEYLR
jgi:hypothetical protein